MSDAIEVAEASGTTALETFQKAMELLIARVAEDMDELTSDAVDSGAEYSKKLVAANK